MLGVFEINSEHEFYHLTAVIKEGIRASIQSAMETAAQVEKNSQPPVGLEMWNKFTHKLFICLQDALTAEDFKAEETQGHKASD